jgi:hypothetical protein
MLGMAKIMREYGDDEVLWIVGSHDDWPKGVRRFEGGEAAVEVHPRPGGGHRVTLTQTFDFDGDALVERLDEERIRAAGWRK